METETERRWWRPMKALVRFAAAWSVLTCMVGISAPGAFADTTYYYVGSPYVT